MMRSVYSTQCQWWQDGTTGLIHWYRADPSAPDLPFPTVFSSRNWDEDHVGYEGLGEVYLANRIWERGDQLFPTANGPPCGTAEDFLSGRPSVEVLPPELNVYGGLACCPLPAEPFLGACQDCFPGGAWSDYSLIVRGMTADLAPSNGNRTLTYKPDVGIPFSAKCWWTHREGFEFPGNALNPWRWLLAVRDDCTAFIQLVAPGGQIGDFYNVPTPDGFFELARCDLNQPALNPAFTGFVILIPGLADLVGRFSGAWNAAVPDNLVVQIRRAGVGLLAVINDQDAPFRRTGSNVWRSTLLWSSAPLPVVGSVPLEGPATLTATADNAMTLQFVTPFQATGRYRAVINPWDETPAILDLQPGAPFPAGLPQSVRLFVQSDLPP